LKIKEMSRAAALAALAAVVILAGCAGGASGGVAWPEYNGFDAENGALGLAQIAGDYLDAIKGRAKGDDPFKKKIRDRCDELKTKRFQAYTNDETYLVLVIAERHSAANNWNRVWKRLGGATVADPNWSDRSRPTPTKLLTYDRNVEYLLAAIEKKFAGNAKILGFCADRRKTPHNSTNRNTSWARILLAYELAISKPGLVGMELDHPEGTTP